jgi:hypothetical protein
VSLLRRAVAVALVSIAAAGAACAAPPDALGPQAPAAKAQGFVGKLAVAPLHGPAGTPLTVTGDGFGAGRKIELVWRTVDGKWKATKGEYHGRAYKPVGYRIAAVTTEAAGTFSVRFAAPDDFGFVHDIVAQQGERLLTQTGFSLDMTLRVTPETGAPGTLIAIDVAGIGWRELENSWMLVYDNGFTGWVSAVTTRGAAHVTIPATGGPGTHVLQLIHGEFTFPYMNPQQNPVPDRPRFRATFRVTPGEPVLPPPVERQAQASVRGLAAPGGLVPSRAFGGIAQPLVVAGQNFTPGKKYRLDWTTVTGNRVAQGGWDDSAKPVAEAVADAAGKIAFRFTVPDDLGGAHGLVVKDAGTERRGSYWITPSALPLASDRAVQGTTIALHLKGVGWSETANIYHVVYDNAYVGYACGFNSQGDVTVDLPATGEPGWHFIDLYPGIYKGEETRPNNFRIPQLTYAADHPGEDLPAFHYAVRVTEAGGESARN